MTTHIPDTKTPLMGRIESLTVVAVLGVLALALGVVALTGSATKTVTTKTMLRDSGVFTYSAKAARDSVYGAAGLNTGQPIITSVLGPVTARFSYTLSASSLNSAHGSADMTAVVTLDQGFSKSFSVATNTSFSGDAVTVSGTLPTAPIKTYVESANAALRDTAGPFGATVALVPHISVSGVAGDQSFVRSFSPALPFHLAGSTLALDSTPDSGGDTTLLLKPTATGYVAQHTSAARPVSLLVTHVSRNAAMIAGFSLAALCLLAGLWLARPLLRHGDGTNDGDRVRALYGSQLTPVRALHVPQAPIAEVASMSALADLAKQYESRIIHLNAEDGDTYVVWDNGMLYRYRAGELTNDAPATMNERLVVWPVVVTDSADRDAFAALVD